MWNFLKAPKLGKRIFGSDNIDKFFDSHRGDIANAAGNLFFPGGGQVATAIVGDNIEHQESEQHLSEQSASQINPQNQDGQDQSQQNSF